VDVFYVHTDHLNTPRRVSRPVGNTIVWRWDSDPFGEAPANSDPDGDAAQFVYNLRFPGQYADQETGLHYNYFRDYDAGLGRYVQSDPIGLAGGSNTYAYVEGNPVANIDLLGLAPGNTKFPVSYYLRECDPVDRKECDAKCSPNRTLTCKRRFNRRLVGMQNDNPIFNYVRADLYCNCDDPGLCESNPKKCVATAAAVLGLGLAICLAPEVTIPGLIVGAAAQ
jgi:RHS repeat-associated protein